LSAACRPSPTRSSLLRQELNRPGSAAGRRRLPARPTGERAQRSATEATVAAENPARNCLQRQRHVTKQERAASTPALHDAADPPPTA